MRYDITDSDKSIPEYTITDSKTLESIVIHFAWVGKDMNKTGTWDYYPLFEMEEINKKEFNDFRLRLHQDDDFAGQQLIMNRRHDIWWDLHKEQRVYAKKPRRGTTGHTTLHTRYNSNTLKCKDIDGKKFLFSGNLEDQKILETHPEWLIESRVWRILTEYRKAKKHTSSLLARFLWRMKINISAEDHERFKSHTKSLKLLKEWVSEDELRWLCHQGELSIKHGDETYIIKKDAYSTVKVVDGNNNVKQYCMVLKESGATIPDILLSKILMIKTNPKKFKETAILRR